MKPFCLEVRGDYACFTRPEMKVERVSYDLITPSAARAVFEAILWKPGIRWRMRRIDVLAPVRWISVRRNEVGEVISVSNVQSAMKRGNGDLCIYVDDRKTRQQRAGLFLRDVAYRLYADMEFLSRADAGQCVNQPYLGCREFAARFRRVELTGDARCGVGPGADEPMALQEWTADLGWMLYDMDFSSPASPQPRFFRAKVEQGVVDLTAAEVRG